MSELDTTGTPDSRGWEIPTIGGVDWQDNPDPVEESDPLGLGKGVYRSEGKVPRGFRPTASPQALEKLRQDYQHAGEQAAAFEQGKDIPFEVYVHVPFCYRRCGYCDFNTYTTMDFGEGASRENFANELIKEMELYALWQQSAGMKLKPASTVYFGGGTPTILPAADLVRMLTRVRQIWGLLPANLQPDNLGYEASTEANPDTVSEQSINELAEGGFTRISLGMQSAVPHVLQVLDRTHNQANVVSAVGWAKKAGFSTSLDLIYGAPGESVDDWKRSLDAVLSLEPDHISCYALTVAPGTKMGQRIAHGELETPRDDDEARKYEIACERLAQAGYQWYEVSNWAKPGHEDRHNLGYWRGADWAGLGPGAHAHAGNLRSWDTRHPKVWTRQVEAGILPWAGHEIITGQEAREEKLMLSLRLYEGIAFDELVSTIADGDATQRARAREQVNSFCEQGLLECFTDKSGQLRVRPTVKGKLLNDGMIEAFLG